MSDQTPTLRWCFTHDDEGIAKCRRGVSRGDSGRCNVRDAVVVPADDTLWKVQPRCTESTLTGHQWWDGTCLMCGGVERVVVPVYPKEET